MSLLLLLRNWLGGGEPPAPGQAYRLRGTIARASRTAGTLRRLGGPAGSLTRATTLTGSITRV